MKACQEVEWLTTEEIIDELMRRETFMGVIIRPASVEEEVSDSFTMSSKGFNHEHLAEVLQLAMKSL